MISLEIDNGKDNDWGGQRRRGRPTVATLTAAEGAAIARANDEERERRIREHAARVSRDEPADQREDRERQLRKSNETITRRSA